MVVPLASGSDDHVELAVQEQAQREALSFNRNYLTASFHRFGVLAKAM